MNQSGDRATRPVAIVTGASSGIGEATAERPAEAGYAVAIAARRVERLEDLAGRIRSRGGEVLVVAGDITDGAYCERLVSEAIAWGPVEVLIANAGFGYSGDFEDMKDEEMRQMIDVNILGVFRSVKAILPHMRERRSGKIVLIGSVLSRVATPGSAVYTATKHAVVGFADSLRFEVSRHGIRVISVLPGYTSTEFFDVMIRRGERAADKIKQYWFFHSSADVAEVILRRLERPCAEAVVGVMNLGVVLLGTRLPCVFRRLMSLVQRVSEAKP